jgi:hypothetical protein
VRRKIRCEWRDETGAKEVGKIYNGPGRNDDISCEHAMEFGIVDYMSVKTKETRLCKSF